jgi:hypothetical protein
MGALSYIGNAPNFIGLTHPFTPFPFAHAAIDRPTLRLGLAFRSEMSFGSKADMCIAQADVR